MPPRTSEMADRGLDKTLHLLTHTGNGAAIDVLVAALDSGDATIHSVAVRGLLTRREEAGHLHVLRRWPDLDDNSKSAAAEFPGRLFAPIRDDVTSGDLRLAEVACDAALWTADYDLAPVLAMIAEDASDPCADLAASTLLQLTEKLYGASRGPRDYRDRRDPHLMRARVCSNLEAALAQQELRRIEAIESFLQLCMPDSPGLKRMLQNKKGDLCRLVLQVLRTSRRPGVVQLLIDLLDDPHTPLTVAGLVCEREDRAFLTALFDRAADGPSPNLARSLKRVTASAWIGEDLAWLDSLDGRRQRGAIEMLLATRISSDAVFPVISYLGVQGSEEGRCAAATALSGFAGPDANQLVLRALDDESPAVQAEVLGQLRERRLPGALPRLIELLECPHDAVREKARACLSEFTLPRFLAAFDLLDEDVQRSTGQLVRQVDPNAVPGLVREFKADHRHRRRQGLIVAGAMGVLSEVEDHVLDLLSDRDVAIRVAAAEALGACNSANALAALRQALVDQDPKVRLAAEKSIRTMLPNAAASPVQNEEHTLLPASAAPPLLAGDAPASPAFAGDPT